MHKVKIIGGGMTKFGRHMDRNLKSLVAESQRLTEFDTRRPRDDSFYKDDRNVGLWAKKRVKELGVDLGSSFDETVEKARSGKILDDL
jgi:hypothetical protein